jgi:hypothetical protein
LFFFVFWGLPRSLLHVSVVTLPTIIYNKSFIDRLFNAYIPVTKLIRRSYEPRRIGDICRFNIGNEPMSGTQYTTLPPEKQAFILKHFMNLFRGNDRGYGVGEFAGAKFDEDKNKWKPGHLRWTHGKPGDEQFHSHLSGNYLIGIGPICDDATCWFATLDVDKYDLDYIEEMEKIKRLGLPLVVFRTKSGGLRVTIFFSEAIDAVDVISRMKRLAGVLGYSGCEIFPKQASLAKEGDCPNWIFLPYGGTGGIFPEQGCMNEMGNLMEIGEAMDLCTKSRIDRTKFMSLFAEEDKAKSNGKTNGSKHPKGAWVQEDTHEKTVDTMFWGGPPCLWTIVHTNYQHFQNNVLLACGVLFKHKYPDNWEGPLDYVNLYVLRPSGDPTKLAEVKKSLKSHDYNYRCKDEPIVGFCFSDACRRQPYGVGRDGGTDSLELGMTIVNCVPRQFWVNVGEHRISFVADELLTQQRYKIKCLEHGVPFPNSMKREDWESLVRRAIENATVVEPTSIMRTGAAEMEMISTWFARHVPIWIKLGRPDDRKDVLRVVEKEQRIYFKWENFVHFLRSAYSDREVKTMRSFLDEHCEEHGKEGRGHWWRCTWSIRFDKFDEEVIERWLNPDKE